VLTQKKQHYLYQNQNHHLEHIINSFLTIIIVINIIVIIIIILQVTRESSGGAARGQTLHHPHHPRHPRHLIYTRRKKSLVVVLLRIGERMLIEGKQPRQQI
jgi:hypothetical protein